MLVTVNVRQPNANLQVHSRNGMLLQVLCSIKSLEFFSDMDITELLTKVFKLIEHHARKTHKSILSFILWTF